MLQVADSLPAAFFPLIQRLPVGISLRLSGHDLLLQLSLQLRQSRGLSMLQRIILGIVKKI